MKIIYGAALASLLTLPVQAQETINLKVASSHPTVVPWVGMIKTHFMARTDEILAETGNYKIEWNEAFGGQLYKANATLSSVEGQAAAEPGIVERPVLDVEPGHSA